MKTDEELAEAVASALDALNSALSEASEAGLDVVVRHSAIPDCDRPNDPPVEIYHATVSRCIQVRTKAMDGALAAIQNRFALRASRKLRL